MVPKKEKTMKNFHALKSCFYKKQISKTFIKIWFNHTFWHFTSRSSFFNGFSRTILKVGKKIIISIFLGLLNVTILYTFDRILLHMLILSMTILYDTYMIGKLSTSVADPGCLSRIPDPDFYPSRTRSSDPGFKNSNKREGWTKISCHSFLCCYKFHKIENLFSFEMLKKII